ncbi:hypothetical protein GZL_p00192 (plasmid) [Streptomyces sp. 769]|nr:hypothetical protein GZL_p00192 [Streptomyces sp. 769]
MQEDADLCQPPCAIRVHDTPQIPDSTPEFPQRHGPARPDHVSPLTRPAIGVPPRAASDTGSRRRQRVKVPWRLVASAHYSDVALSVYMKVKALAQRPEGCTAGAATLAAYLGLSKASVERGITQLRRPAPDGVVELAESTRRSLPGGRGTTARRRVRVLRCNEQFVWLPVIACEELTPRQLRAYAVIVFARLQQIPLSLDELAGFLRHYRGQRAGKPLTAAAARTVVDRLESARWVSVQRRAGAQGRHLFLPHDFPPALGATDERGEAWSSPAPVGSSTRATALRGAPPRSGEGSGATAGDGSLAKEESPRTDRHENASRRCSPAVGETPQGRGVEPVDDLPGRTTGTAVDTGLALRADKASSPPDSTCRDSRTCPLPKPSYTGPQLTISQRIYAVLEPVRWLLARVNNPFLERKVAREVGRQLREGTTPERLHHRLTVRLAGTMVSDIREPGRWLLGVALPRWGCGHPGCESGVMWATADRCEECAEIISARRAHQGFSPARGTRPGTDGFVRYCEADEAPTPAAPTRRARELDGTPHGSCDTCGARIRLIGRALEDGLCKPCREEYAAAASAVSTTPRDRVACGVGVGGAACRGEALPGRTVCARHRIQELAGGAVR